MYAGSWTSDAKRYFSKTGCAAGTLADDYLKGASIRQEYLETAIYWAASAEGKTIEAYMAELEDLELDEENIKKIAGGKDGTRCSNLERRY